MMKTCNILSIDWDYMTDIPTECFAPEINELGLTMYNKLWDIWYTHTLPNVKVHPAFNNGRAEKLIEVIKGSTFDLCVISQEHDNLYRAIQFIDDVENMELYVRNFDTHHDCYSSSSNPDVLNPGNWGRLLYQDMNLKEFLWYRSPDSENYASDKPEYVQDVFDYGPKEIMGHYDLVFICRSDPYVPPHFDYLFKKFSETVLKYTNCNTEILDDVFIPRKHAVPSGRKLDLKINREGGN